MRSLYFIVSFLVLFCTSVFSQITGPKVGEITGQMGSTFNERDGETQKVNMGYELQMKDFLQTGEDGGMIISYVDGTKFTMGPNTELIIDEFVYDPNTKKGSLSLKAALGTVRYASGQIAKTSAANVQIKTPTATIGVRGTDFSMTIDEVGSSTIILLPSCDTNGNCFVGEISVESDAGMVIMNQAFQATVVDTSFTKPLNPVILDIDESLISNLLIISKPKEIEEAIQESEFNKVATALDIDFLKFDESVSYTHLTLPTILLV